MTLDPRAWRTALGLAEEETPVAVILEGTWWERRAYATRTPLLDDVRDLPFPGWTFGWHEGVPLVYVCAYGAPRAVEPVHVLATLGTRLAIQIGSCGSLRPDIRTGDLVVPSRAEIGEGASRYYGGIDVALASPEWVQRAGAGLRSRGFTVHDGHHLTTSALLAQPTDTVQRWHAAGYASVDMETSAVFTVASRFGIDAVSMLFAWDELLAGRGFLAEFDDDEVDRQRAANEATFTVALELVERAAA